MTIHASGEDYLEAVLVLKQEKAMVRSVDLELFLALPFEGHDTGWD